MLTGIFWLGLVGSSMRCSGCPAAARMRASCAAKQAYFVRRGRGYEVVERCGGRNASRTNSEALRRVQRLAGDGAPDVELRLAIHHRERIAGRVDRGDVGDVIAGLERLERRARGARERGVGD